MRRWRRSVTATGGLYRMMADGRPITAGQLAERTGTAERLFYSASTLVCTPASQSQEPGAALGAQAGEARLGEIARQAGFSRFRRATETPFNLVLEARP